MKQDLYRLIRYSHGTGISWDTLLKNTSNANASTNAPTKQGPSRLHAALAVGHVPSFAAFPYMNVPASAENPGPTSDVFVEICVMRVAKHGAHRMFAGNLWQCLSCLCRQLPLQLLTPEHSHSNPKNMN